MPGQLRDSWPTVKAESYEHALHGRNRAVLLGCMSAAGRSFACVVKLYHRVENKDSYWIEWVSGRLAERIGITCPEQYVVEISQAMAAVIGGKTGEDAAASARPSFGTQYVRSTIPFPTDGGAIEEGLRASAAELAAFDVFIDNPDRRRENPNLLVDAREPGRLLAIDHDLAFSSFVTILIGAGTWPHDILAGHVLARRFGTKKPSLARVKAAISELSDGFLDHLLDETPPMWLTADAPARLSRVISKLKERRDSIDTWFPALEDWL